ncbi:MAG: ATP-binding protein [Candidatus Eisenbacteria bacterium]
MLEAGVQAIREGRFDARIPETGSDEFRRLARDLNLLSAQFARERANHGEAREGSSGNGNAEAREGRAAAELLGDAILAIGPDHRIVLANEEAGRLLGLAPKQLTQRRLEEAFPADHPVRQLVTQLHSGQERSLVAPLQSAGRVAVAHRVPGGGSLVELKWAWQQEELHALVDHSRVVSRLAQMSAGVAHEIGNPLANISLELETLRDAHELSDDEVQSHVTVASQNVQKVQRAITGFLTVARLRRPDPTEIRLDALLEDAAQSRQAEADLAGIELVLEIGRDAEGRAIVFEADRQVLLQAIDNLIKNALQAGPSREGKVWLRGGLERDTVRIEVEDSGPGIAEENREQVFQLYFTTKRGGTGVGLALVRQAVELHAGTVTLDSALGRGTRFILALPLSARAH